MRSLLKARPWVVIGLAAPFSSGEAILISVGLGLIASDDSAGMVKEIFNSNDKAVRRLVLQIIGSNLKSIIQVIR